LQADYHVRVQGQVERRNETGKEDGDGSREMPRGVSGRKTLTNSGQTLPFFVSGVTNRGGRRFEKGGPGNQTIRMRTLSTQGLAPHRGIPLSVTGRPKCWGGITPPSTVWPVASASEASGACSTSESTTGLPNSTSATWAALYRVVRSSPQRHGWRRPTWTRELRVETLARQAQVRVHAATTSRALTLIRARCGRPRPTAHCP
jgi:hypothetical protein